MKRLLISLTLALMLVGIVAMPAMATEDSLSASVTVNEIISVTISDAASNGIQFGSVDAPSTDNPDADQSTTDDTTPAVTVAIGAGTNVDVDVSLKGTDFDATIPITGASWALAAHDATKNSMSTSYQEIQSGVTAGSDVNLWHFLSIPGSAAGGTFASTFTYQVLATP